MGRKNLLILNIICLLNCANANSGDQQVATSWTLPSDDVIAALSPCYAAINFNILDRNQGRLEVTEGETVQFSLSLNQFDNNSIDCSLVLVRVAVEAINIKAAALVNSDTDMLSAELVDSTVISLRKNDRFPARLYARGLFLGYSNLHFQVLPKDVNATDSPDLEWVTFRSGKIATFRYHRLLDTIFQGIIFTLIICGNIGIGLEVDWKEIRNVLKKPIGPAIGFGCQYIVMPLAGFTVVNVIDLPPNVAMGVFLMGCAPGGGGSNYHTYFLGGNLPLSVAMTFVSTAAAVFMMPFWVFTLGRLVASETRGGIHIDYRGIFGALFNSIAPFLIGILIRWRRPKLASYIFRVFVRPLLLFVFVYMLTVGTFTNLYLFKLMSPKLLLAGLLLPYSGFALGFVIALLLRQSRSIAVTIAIETGIQAAGVAFATLYLSLPQPDADIAVVGPLAVILFTPVPLWISEILRGIYLCIIRRRCFIFDSCRKGNKSDGHGDDGEGILTPADIENGAAAFRKKMGSLPRQHSTLSTLSNKPLLSPILESPPLSPVKRKSSLIAEMLPSEEDEDQKDGADKEPQPVFETQSSTSSQSSEYFDVPESPQ